MLLVTSMALTACGCFGGGGGGGGGRTASRGGRFSPERKETQVARGGKSNNRRVSAETESLSPEGSMQRDLARLHDREKAQVKVVKEMRDALSQGEDVIVREERKLDEIRTQIARFDSAMRNQEMASAGRRGRPAPAASTSRNGVVPASMYVDNDRDRHDPSYARAERAPAPSRDRARVEPASYRRDDYARDTRDSRDSRNNNDRAPSRNDRDEVLYNPMAARDEPSRSYGGMNEARNQPQQRRSSQEKEWVASESLFTESAPRSAPTYRDAQTYRSNAPVSNNTLRPMPAQQKVSAAPEPAKQVSVPAAGASTQPRQPAPSRQESLERHSGDDEVFTPDLYLSGGR